MVSCGQLVRHFSQSFKNTHKHNKNSKNFSVPGSVFGLKDVLGWASDLSYPG